MMISHGGHKSTYLPGRTTYTVRTRVFSLLATGTWCGIVDDALTRQDSLGQDSLSGIPVRHCGAGRSDQKSENLLRQSSCTGFGPFISDAVDDVLNNQLPSLGAPKRSLRTCLRHFQRTRFRRRISVSRVQGFLVRVLGLFLALAFNAACCVTGRSAGSLDARLQVAQEDAPSANRAHPAPLSSVSVRLILRLCLCLGLLSFLS